MTLRTLISFDSTLLTGSNSLTLTTNYGSQNQLYSNYGQPGNVMSYGSPGAPVVTNTGWLLFGTNSANAYAGYFISFADLNILQNGATQAWFGFRTYAGSSTAGAGSSVVSICSNISWSNTVLLTEAQLARLGVGVSYSQYVECFIDTANLVFQVYVNSILVNSGSLASGAAYVLLGGASVATSIGQAFRDMYFLDVDTTAPFKRLGAITSTPLTSNIPTYQSLPNYNAYTGTMTGTATISTAQFKFSVGSLNMGATTSSVVTFADSPSLRNTGNDCTYECWIYNPATPIGSGVFFGKDTNASPYSRIEASTGGLISGYLNSATLINGTGTVATMIAGAWNHIALVSYSGTWNLYLNGVPIPAFNVANSTGFGNNTSVLGLGNVSGASNILLSSAYMSEFRISNIARYTATFTPPTAAFVSDVNTMLLAHLNQSSGGYVADTSENAAGPLQTAYSAAVAMIPNIQNAATNDQMSLGFTSTAVPGQKIVGMQYRMAAQVPSAINLAVNLSEGANQKALTAYQFKDTVANYSRDIAGIQLTAPDGGSWTAASVNATMLQLTPTPLV